MRVTLSIDDDVLLAAKALAEEQGRSVGTIISGLARNSLRKSEGRRNSIPLLGMRADAGAVTLDMVNALRDGVA